MHSKKEDTESVLAAIVTTEKSMPRSDWEKKNGTVAKYESWWKASKDLGQEAVVRWVEKYVTEQKEIEGVNGVSLKRKLMMEDRTRKKRRNT